METFTTWPSLFIYPSTKVFIPNLAFHQEENNTRQSVVAEHEISLPERNTLMKRRGSQQDLCLICFNLLFSLSTNIGPSDF